MLIIKVKQNIFVNTVGGLFSGIKARNTNTAAAPVTAMQDERTIKMSEEYKEICKYKQSMMMAQSMLQKGIISEKDYARIDKILANKYGVSSCSIYRQNA